MRDFPFFTTEAGIAALTLAEIPYKQEAYIKLLDTQDPKALLEECLQFCKAAGAERIYASGNSYLEQYPKHTVLLKMCGVVDKNDAIGAFLFPLQKETMTVWQEIYNRRMQNVPNAATMTSARLEEIFKKGSGYFVHKDGAILGIGVASDETVDVVISEVPGAGELVMRTLCNALPGERVFVEVASTNMPAVSLYERLGFVVTEELSEWYQVL